MTRRAAAAVVVVALLLSSLLLINGTMARGVQTTPPPVAAPTLSSQSAVERIRDEGLNRSQLTKTLSYLTEVIGPRLTGSPNVRRANDWTLERLKQWGLSNAHLEAWGPFGRGWSLERFSAEVVAPQSFPLVAYPKAWSPGTDGAITGDVVYVEADTEAALQAYKGKLKGAFVLIGSIRGTPAGFAPRATRLSDQKLLELANAPDPPSTVRPPTPRQPSAAQLAAQNFAARKMKFYYEEGAALLIDSSPGGDGGAVQFVQGYRVPVHLNPDGRVRAWDVKPPKLIPQIGVSNDHYNHLARMLQQGLQPRMAVNIAVRFHDADLMGYNTIAEIPGGDLKEEVVMLGAHLDSWHTATGATDNAAGVGVMMEAVRILQALKLQPRRTIRIALWTGEEQGGFGSESYVARHFGTGKPAALEAKGGAGALTKPEYDKLSVYFNLDGGTGKIRGIYLQDNSALRPIFREWLAPLADLGASTIAPGNSSGSDFLSFDAVGLPGLDFLQDDIEYETRTWHSNQDTFDRLQFDDLKQASVVVATFVYNAAMRDQKLPRKNQK